MFSTSLDLQNDAIFNFCQWSNSCRTWCDKFHNLRKTNARISVFFFGIIVLTLTSLASPTKSTRIFFCFVKSVITKSIEFASFKAHRRHASINTEYETTQSNDGTMTFACNVSITC